MREIKFRSWTGKKIIPVAQIDFRYSKPLVLDNDEPNYEKKETAQWELMQFTGLKDKNGKEIYEGDIVELPNISWFRGRRIRVAEFGYEKCNTGWTAIGYMKELECGEVIGNIYENQELIAPPNSSEIKGRNE